MSTRPDLAQAVGGLPLDADKNEVLSWIENHPAMILDRELNAEGRVELEVSDLVGAPSRSAVGQLQHWVNRKEEFYREWLRRKPIPKEDEEDTEREAMEELDPSLGDVVKMLDDIGC